MNILLYLLTQKMNIFDHKKVNMLTYNLCVIPYRNDDVGQSPAKSDGA